MGPDPRDGDPRDGDPRAGDPRDGDPRDGDGPPVFADERRRRILEIVESRGRVRVRELAALVGVAEPTIRKDIADLDRKRLLHRTHGGALARRPEYEPDLGARGVRNAAGKAAIARACLAEIKDGDAVFLDSGTTTRGIAELLLPEVGRAGRPTPPHNVNVLTNAFGVAQVLSTTSHVRHTVVGGQYRPMGGSFVGPLAVGSLRKFTLNTAFLGVTGVAETGLSVADLADAQVKVTAMECARRVVVPMDHTKVGVTDFVRLCELDRVDTVVTDRATDHLRELCAAHDVRLVVAD